MALDITGKILQIMPTTTGTSKAGKDWVKQEFVIETQETYPKKVCISVMGEKTQELKKYVPGNEVKVSLNLESREYNGKWYTNVNAWRIESASGAPASAAPQEDPFHPDNEPSFTADSSSDDLPF
ncbi:MAG: DUF3127 domain-containing protein [Bacteroidia bacterium]|nr:DUF3127 domain-containing protein [Bacteroidia bacterium]MCF8425676.1 DUF3127 domain-containing protein [Bacteroidia bacterium]MCF8447273.1 DUF3127 domain-containing protein [Bacteroidia bacterium]